jgi:3'(2'), 5'-bisphosphate nucleotidase
VAAGAVIRRYYDAGPMAVDDKIDGSPVTRADLEANEVILGVLRERFAADAVLSEESADDRGRLQRARLWIVDPLDGTRDFVARSGEFAVHVALAIDGRAAVAAVYQPVGDRLYAATAGGGATVTSGGSTRPLAVSAQKDAGAARIGVTRMAPSAALGRFLAETGAVARAVTIGASIKMLALAEGTVDATVCLHGREKEWDTCAPGLIVAEAGGRVTDLDGVELRYNRPDVRLLRGILMSNGLVHETLRRQALPYLS